MPKKLFALAAGFLVAVSLSGCGIMSQDTGVACIDAAADYAKNCIINVDDAACDAAKAQAEECVASIGDDFKDEFEDRLDEILAGIMTAPQAAKAQSGSKRAEQLQRYGDLKAYVDDL